MRKAFAFIGFSSARPGMGENTHKPSSAALAAELERLPSLDFDELVRIWKVRIGRRAPAHLPRYLFVRLLAHRLQAQTLGDLDRSVRSRLEQFAPAKIGQGAKKAAEVKLRSGSVLVREHQGELHRVAVTDVGYEWSGQTYSSLSRVAFAITGTKWNGRRFFRLDQKARPESRGHRR
jgi:hypothetical protein